MTKSNSGFSSSSTRTAGVIVSIIVLSFAIAGMAQAQQINIDVTKPSNNNPYGGEKVGTFSITPEGHVIHLLANMSAAPSSEKYMKDGLLTLAVQGINSV